MTPTPHLRVLMTADALGGVWTYALNLAKAFREHHVEVVLAVMGPTPSADQRRDADQLGNVRLHVSDFKLEWMVDPWADVDAAGQWLARLEHSERPDIVHLNGYAHGVLPLSAPKVIVGHSCCLSWWRALRPGEPFPPHFEEYRTRVQAGLDGVGAFIAPTAAMLTEYAGLYRLGRSEVIYNGAPTPHAARRKEPCVLAAGRVWDEAKNIAVISGAAPDIPWPVYLAGGVTGPCESAVDTHGLQRLGQLPARQMSEALERASVYVHPARYEPFGLLPLEAALRSCALVLADIPTLREVWGDAAVFVPPQSSEGFAAAVCALIADPGRLAEAGARAQQRARHYSLERCGGEYLRLYQDLLGPATAAASVAFRERRPMDSGGDPAPSGTGPMSSNGAPRCV